MYYDINVSIDGKHLFAVAERSAKTYREMIKIKELFVEKFPVEEGYVITITQWVETGKIIEEIGAWQR